MGCNAKVITKLLKNSEMGEKPTVFYYKRHLQRKVTFCERERERANYLIATSVFLTNSFFFAVNIANGNRVYYSVPSSLTFLFR